MDRDHEPDTRASRGPRLIDRSPGHGGLPDVLVAFRISDATRNGYLPPPRAHSCSSESAGVPPDSSHRNSTASQGVRMIAPDTYILGMKVSPTSYDHASQLICEWSRRHLSKYVCIACVNNVMEAYDTERFQRVMNQADLVTPDGMPVVWSLRLLGKQDATRVYGPYLTPILLQQAADCGLPVGFYGASPETLERLLSVVRERFPKLQIAYAFSPPFRPLTSPEDEKVVEDINRSGTRILFIGLNTPKQDYWMSEHKKRVQAVMVGVGAAFDFLAGSKPQAPQWMMKSGLEWCFRLLTEPRRLWKRYLKHNPRFVVLFALQLLGIKKFQRV
jgi:N-acetylglucosaminyldiphosphoundecaprenol N-acetyl-beta-D-mannosaminyltransferase